MLVADAKRSLEPVDVEGFAVLMDPFVEWMELCGIGNLPDDDAARQERVARIVRMYHAELGHLPPDLLEDVLTRTRRRHKWPKLPTPADMLELASGELERRRFALRRLQAAHRVGRVEEPPLAPGERISPEERAEIDVVIKRATASIAKHEKVLPLGPELKRKIPAAPYTAEDLKAARNQLKGRLFVERPAAIKKEPETDE